MNLPMQRVGSITEALTHSVRRLKSIQEDSAVKLEVHPFKTKL